MIKYLTNPHADLEIVRGSCFTTSEITAAIDRVHDMLDKFGEFDVDVFSLLGMRNLSAFVGEAFGATLVKSCNGRFVKNPHQDGYPDLLLLDSAGTALWEELKSRKGEKEPFSPFATGGVEIKATCGAVPTPKVLRKRGMEKPGLGDQRIGLLTGYDWKAHHRETNYLLGCVWDFIDRRPTISGVFYSRTLTEEHWGKIVQPRAGGGRTTSVSIMTRAGIKQMYEGWVACHPDSRYAAFFDKKNRDTLMSQALRASTPEERPLI